MLTDHERGVRAQALLKSIADMHLPLADAVTIAADVFLTLLTVDQSSAEDGQANIQRMADDFPRMWEICDRHLNPAKYEQPANGNAAKPKFTLL